MSADACRGAECPDNPNRDRLSLIRFSWETIVKKLLGLIGSPRKRGNSELLVKEIHKRMGDEWELTLVRLPELDIRPCKGCYQCLFGEMNCVQKDDLPSALEALAAADAYVLAAPTYLLGANASVKLFLDRGLSFARHVDSLWRKPAVGAVIAGLEGMEGYAKLMVDSFLKLTFADHRGSDVIYAALPGEVFLDGDGRAVAARLAEALQAKESPPPAATSEPRCAHCGGDTFRFLEDGRVRCMLCSGGGMYEASEGGLSFDIRPSDHALFLTYEDAKNHFAFLRGMKDKFMARRNELKAVMQEYSDDATWIRPKGREES